jgi:protein tyrosine/serine phosphatase
MWGGVCGVLLALAIQAGYVLLAGNFHTVIPGSVYRCAQPTPADLERIVPNHNIRTVINLRGNNDRETWYQGEVATAERLGVRLVDVSMWGCQPPMPDQLQLLIETLDSAEYPILLHCHSGADRAGLASALALLLRTGSTVDQARSQLAVRYGHNPYGMARCQDRLLLNYHAWLERNQRRHTPDNLRRWVREAYDRDLCR